MQPTDYSIEFSHIYLNETFSHEHQKSISVLKEFIDELDGNDTYSLNVLIDDYNATDEVLDIKDFKQQLEDAGVMPDYLAYEARLVDYSSTLLSHMKENKLKRSYIRYIENKGIIPCSFMIATWYLLRLGALPLNPETLVYEKNGGHSKAFVAKNIVSILPDRFRGVEHKAELIIRATPFAAMNAQIERIYYDGVEERALAGVH